MIGSEDKRLLKLIGITYNQIESGVYAVILEEADGNRRIPIIIGFPEAQAIECKLQEIITPRPLTHDLIVNIMSSFGISLQEVNIYRMESGVFAAELMLLYNGTMHVVDSRSSDAIALAVRTGTPIYTSAAVLDEVGFEPGGSSPAKNKINRPPASAIPESPSHNREFGLKSVEELRKDMQAAADNEDYETAARIKEEIDRRSNNENSDSQ